MKEDQIDLMIWAYEQGFYHARDCLNGIKIDKEKMKKDFILLAKQKLNP